MNIDCPGKNLPEWKKLTEAIGEDKAHLAYFRNGNKIPSVEEAKGLLEKNQTETPAFKEWFGDSKVVDEAGKPKVVYHGTDSPHTEFDKGKIGSNYDADEAGFFFISDPKEAEYAADDAAEKNSGNQNIKPVYLSIEKPYTIKSEDGMSASVFYDNNKNLIWIAAKESGADGIIVYGTKGGISSKVRPDALYVAFEPEQIKSATGNRGSFDPKNPDIRFQKEPPAPESGSGWVEDGVKRDETGKFQEGSKFSKEPPSEESPLSEKDLEPDEKNPATKMKDEDAPPVIDRTPDASYEESNPYIPDAEGKALPDKKVPASTFMERAGAYLRNLYKTVTETPEYSEFKKTVLTFHGNMQRWNYRANAVTDYIKQAVKKDKTRDAAIAAWMEAGGNTKELKRQAGLTEKKEHRAKYEAAMNLTDEEKAIGRWAREQYNTLWKEAFRRGMIDEFRKNYVNHILDKGGVKPQGYGGELLARFAHDDPRKIPTMFDMEQLGYAPETDRLSDLLPSYIMELGKAIETQDFFRSLITKTDKDGNPIGAMQSIGDAVEEEIQQSLFEDPNAAYRIIKETKGTLPEGIIYRAIDHPALSNWMVIKDKNGRKKLYKCNIVIQSKAVGDINYWRHVKNIVGTDAIREWYREERGPAMQALVFAVKALESAQSFAKRGMFAIPGFHWVQEGTHALWHGVNPFNVGKVDLENNVDHQRAAVHGLNVGSSWDGAAKFGEGVSIDRLWKANPTFEKTFGKAGEWLNSINEPLFKWYIPALKMKTYEHILGRNKDLYKPELKAGSKTIDDIEYLSARQTNAAYGELNYTDLGRNKLVQHVMRVGLLAPNFLEARARFVGQAAKHILNPAEKSGREQYRALALNATIMLLGPAIINKITTGDDHLRDAPFKIVVGKRTFGFRNVAEDVFNLFKNSDMFIKGRISPIYGKTAWFALDHRDYRGQKETWAQFLEKELAPAAVPIGAKGFLPGAGGNKDIAPWQILASSLGVQFSRHSDLPKVYDLVDDWRDKTGVEKQDVDYPPSKYRDVHNALADNDFDKAREEYQALIEEEMKRTRGKYSKAHIEAKIKAGMEASVYHYWTGSEEDDKDFIKSLNDEGRQAVKAAQLEKKVIYHRFLQMQGDE